MKINFLLFPFIVIGSYLYVAATSSAEMIISCIIFASGISIAYMSDKPELLEKLAKWI